MQKTPPTDWTAYAPPRWVQHALTTEDGRRYRLAVTEPQGAAPDEGWPSLTVLDGAAHFAPVAGAAAALARRPEKTGVGPLAVIGVFHEPDDDARDGDARFRDYTDTAPPPGEGAGRPWGGAEAFRRTLEETVLPLVQARLPLAPARRAVFGHSLGGLFVIETLQRRPDLFARGVAVSPSLWWRPDLAAGPGGAVLMLGIGARETGRDMGRRIADWSARAGAAATVAPGADHGAAPLALIPDALRHVCAS